MNSMTVLSFTLRRWIVLQRSNYNGGRLSVESIRKLESLPGWTWKSEQERRNPDEWVKVAEQLAKDHGKLPFPNWLDTHRYTGLASCMQKYPEKFKHIEQETPYHSAEESVKIAQMLAEKHGAFPRWRWLNDNGYAWLYARMQHKPELFAHILKQADLDQAKRQALGEELRTLYATGQFSYTELESCFNVSETFARKELQAEAKGRRAAQLKQIADIRRLHAAGLTRRTLAIRFKVSKGVIDYAINRSPERLATRAVAQADKPKRRATDVGSRKSLKKKTLSDHVKIFENLAAEPAHAEHGGLPRPTWLQQNGYAYSHEMMTIHPEVFAHIPKQEAKFKTLDQWVKAAEKLAAENGGVLQNPSRLGSAIYNKLHDHPEAFAHIPQSGRNMVLDRHVADAERLAAENEGKLQPPVWLKANGYGPLYQITRKYPERFAHIPMLRAKPPKKPAQSASVRSCRQIRKVK